MSNPISHSYKTFIRDFKRRSTLDHKYTYKASIKTPYAVRNSAKLGLLNRLVADTILRIQHPWVPNMSYRTELDPKW